MQLMDVASILNGRLNRLRKTASSGPSHGDSPRSSRISRCATYAFALAAGFCAAPLAKATEPDSLVVSDLQATPSLPTSHRISPVVRAIKSAESAVVNIQGNKTVSANTSTGTGKQEVNGMGTGVIIDPRGYIITNLHVVQDVSRIEVTLADGTNSTAKMLNYDPETDLALIKIQVDKSLPVIPIGSSHDLMRGETVIAIGNPFGYQHTVTVGIVSALHRNIPVNGSQEYRDLIQTNADINPGNSGGPLVNIDGKVIGINVAVRVGAQGIGFAIPIDAALEVMADLVADSNPDAVAHGLALETIHNEQHTQTRVAQVNAVATAAAGDLHAGDIVKSINGKMIYTRLDTELCMLDRQTGDEVEIEIERDGRVQQRTLRLVQPNSQRTQEWLAKEAWEKLGVRLAIADKQEVQTSTDKFQGGLRVIEVRPGSPAAREKIIQGDIIVGILTWQTPTVEALAWILKSPEFNRATTAKFFVVRNNQIWHVAMKVPNTKVR